MSLNCLKAIRSSYHKFSEKEKKIADYILEKPELVIHRTINEVAEDLNIADATVFRFSKHIGFKGFQAMKIALASEITAPAHTIIDETNKESEKALVEKIFTSNIRTLQNTIQMLDHEALHQAVDLILQANRVELYGTAGSTLVAMDTLKKFIRRGIKAFAYMDPETQLLSASQLTKDDVAFFISHSGTNPETLRILTSVQATGAKTIAITSDPKSPISVNVDIALYTDAEVTEYFKAGFSSQVAQICLIDSICLSIGNMTKANNSSQ